MEWYKVDLSDYTPSELCMAIANLENAKENLENILTVIYGANHVDENFENEIDELCDKLSVKFPHGKDMQIEKKNQTLREIASYLQQTQPI